MQAAGLARIDRPRERLTGLSGHQMMTVSAMHYVDSRYLWEHIIITCYSFVVLFSGEHNGDGKVLAGTAAALTKGGNVL